MGNIYGYARVSTAEQNLDRQTDALKAAGVSEENIYTEKMSGTKKNRSQLIALKDKVAKGDVVVVEALNRLGRSSVDLIDTMRYLNDKGVILKSLKECIDFSSATGKMLASLFAVLAQFERDCIAERVVEGVAAARKRGRVGGRPRVDEKDLKRALTMYEEKRFSVSEICRLCSIGKSTFFRYLHKQRATDEYNEIDIDNE